LPAEFLEETGPRAQVVGVRMGFDYPRDLEILLGAIPGDLAGRPGMGSSGRGIIVEHWIDDGRGAGCVIPDDVAEGVSRLMQEMLYA
jgi:hypothetical protein